MVQLGLVENDGSATSGGPRLPQLIAWSDTGPVSFCEDCERGKKAIRVSSYVREGVDHASGRVAPWERVWETGCVRCQPCQVESIWA